MAIRLLALACVAGICYADDMTGLSGWKRGACEILKNKDWNTTGEDLQTIDDVASAEACQALCQANPACETFTWGHANATKPNTALVCWLKESSNLTVTSVDVLTDYDQVDSGACPIGGENVTTSADTGSSGSGSSSLAWWAWLLLALAALALIGGLAYFLLMGKKEAPKKKKRAVKAAAPEPAPAPAVPVVTAPPIYTAPPVYMQAQPVYTTAAPQVSFVEAAAPMYTEVVAPMATAMPIAQAMPIASVAMPIQPATVVGTEGVVISRAEFDQFGMNLGEAV